MTEDPHRKEQLRIQALGAAISIRNWHLAEKAYAAIRDAFDAKPLPGQAILDEAAVRADERERCAKIAEQEAKGWEASAAGVAAFTIAAAIRGPLPGQAILDEVFPAPANKGVRMGVDNDNA